MRPNAILYNIFALKSKLIKDVYAKGTYCKVACHAHLVDFLLVLKHETKKI